MAALGSVQQQPFNPHLHQGYAGSQHSQGYPLQQYINSGSDASSSSSSEDSPASTVRRIYPERSYRPADSLIPLSARPAFRLESQIDRLIERAFIPLAAKMEVSEQGRYFMATNMEDLKDLILECFPAAPSVPKNKKKFQSPRYPGESLKIQSLFRKLLRAAIPVKDGRGLELAHIDFGGVLAQHVFKIEKQAKGGKDLILEGGGFNQLKFNVGKQRHKQLFPNMPAYESILAGQLKFLQKAVKEGKFFVEECANAEVIGNQSGFDASQEYVRQNAARTAANIAATGRAFAQATAIAPPPATSMIVANPYWSPSNDASYVAMRAPNGVYY